MPTPTSTVLPRKKKRYRPVRPPQISNSNNIKNIMKTLLDNIYLSRTLASPSSSSSSGVFTSFVQSSRNFPLPFCTLAGGTHILATSTNSANSTTNSKNSTQRTEFDEDWEEYNPNSGPFIHHMIAGSFSGFVEHAGMYPVDWIKTHMQANRHASAQDMSKYVQQQSIRTLYRGVTAVFAGVVPAHSAYYSIYEVAKDRFGANRRGHHPMAAAASGAVATIAHDAVMTPLDVVKQRMQLGVYQSISQALRNIIKTEGVSSLFLSLPTTIIMNIPAASVNVAVNESCRRILNPSGDYDMSTYMISGTFAGGIAGGVTNPLDVIKTRLQTQTIGCNSEGCGALFQGGVEVGNSSTRAGSVNVSGASSASASSKSANKPIMLSKSFVHTSSASSKPLPLKVPSVVVGPANACARKYNGFWGTASLILKEEGMNGFARGTLSRILTHAPAAAFSWTAYEAGKSFLNGRL